LNSRQFRALWEASAKVWLDIWRLLGARQAKPALVAMLVLAIAAFLVVGPTSPPASTPGATAASVALGQSPTPGATSGLPLSLPLPTNVPPTAVRIHLYFPFAGNVSATAPSERVVTEPTPSTAELIPSPTPKPVARAKPTATVPPPTPIPRQPITKVTKLGVGVYGLHASDSELDALLLIQPTVIVLQDPDMEFARKVRYYFPKAFIVGRIFFASQPLDNPEQRGIEVADKVAEMAVPRKGLIDAWISYNEPVSHNDYAAYEAYNRFQVAFAQRLQGQYGIPAVAGNDAPGAIEPADYVKYFSEAIRASQYFGIHAYSKPDNYTFRTEDAAYYALRYRLIHEELERAGISNVKMVVTEAGLANGWRYKVKPEQMAEEFFWLADEMEKDPYMIGYAIYGVFTGGGVPGWQDHDIRWTRLVDLLGSYQPRR